MKRLITLPVELYLSGFSQDAQTNVLQTFTSYRVASYTGPHRFYRAAGRNAAGDLARAYGGGYWADENVLLAIAKRLERTPWLTTNEQKAAWPAHYRALTALSHDWNDMSEMFVLSLPEGDILDGICGPAKAQPEFSKDSSLGQHSPSRTFPGGDLKSRRLLGYLGDDPIEQVFFKVKNPLWIERVQLW